LTAEFVSSVADPLGNGDGAATNFNNFTEKFKDWW